MVQHERQIPGVAPGGVATNKKEGTTRRLLLRSGTTRHGGDDPIQQEGYDPMRRKPPLSKRELARRFLMKSDKTPSWCECFPCLSDADPPAVTVRLHTT
jgi:hypothetical protein